MEEIRTSEEVINSHLLLRLQGKFEEDIKLNYSEGCIFLTGFGEFTGHEGMRQLVKKLESDIPNVKFDYKKTLIRDKIAFLEWTGRSDTCFIEDGADSYLVENGKITAQTIHYTVREYS
jgi:hypothetical protein